LGLFHVIGSYCGQFVISATSCRVMMPDPAFYRECLQDSFDELLAATNAAPKPKAACVPNRRRPLVQKHRALLEH
jgi:diacylglycerol O-acyltransferase / wax synthase